MDAYKIENTQFSFPWFSIFVHFFIQNHTCTITYHDQIDIKRCRIFLCIFLFMWKVGGYPPTKTPTQKFKTGFFPFWFSGNWFNFGIISNNFWSCTISAIPIQRSHTEFKSMARISIERNICLDTEKNQITRADFIGNTKTSVKNQELGWA